MDNSWDDDMLDDGDGADDGDDDMAEDDEECDDDEEDGLDRLGPTHCSVYRRKYNLLLERCRAIHQDNELLLSRVKEVQKLWKRGLRDRRLLVARLESHGDNFRNVPIVFPVEDDVVGKKFKDKKMKKANQADEPTASGSGRGRRTKGDKDKAPRDPNLPKRPQNPFFQFCKEKRDVVAQDVYKNQGVNLTKKELTKILANQWNSLNPTEKLIYNERFEEEKAGYTIKMEVYRKLKDESEAAMASRNSSGPAPAAMPPLISLNPQQPLSSPFGSNYDYDDSFD